MGLPATAGPYTEAPKHLVNNIALIALNRRHGRVWGVGGGRGVTVRGVGVGEVLVARGVRDFARSQQRPAHTRAPRMLGEGGCGVRWSGLYRRYPGFALERRHSQHGLWRFSRRNRREHAREGVRKCYERLGPVP